MSGPPAQAGTPSAASPEDGSHTTSANSALDNTGEVTQHWTTHTPIVYDNHLHQSPATPIMYQYSFLHGTQVGSFFPLHRTGSCAHYKTQIR